MATLCRLPVVSLLGLKGLWNRSFNIAHRTSSSSNASQQLKSFHCSHGGVRAEAGQSLPEGPEYIPKRKAKNPMRKVTLAWIIGFPSGIIGFLLAKRQVDKNRAEQLKIRQRMKKANEGLYNPNQYRTPLQSERPTGP
ncbi:DUF4748 domain-containing protein [Polypterus senegalus]|uniref:DUF4748 domain-containing protein n=1 Tax=Polypterus senegalus TaxID=55291 RepID=UPI00196556DA|nr:DUF4748 domain-containing protein [Polypterus senegalus]